jgi:fatty acid desaturase
MPPQNPDHRVAALAANSNIGRWLGLTLLDWSVIVGAIAIAGYSNNLIVYWLASVVIGNRQQALGIMGHEGAHGLICGNKRLNNTLADALCFWCFGASFYRYREFHLKHHRTLGTLDDPELPLRDKLIARPVGRLTIARYFVGYMLGLDILKFSKILMLIRPRGIRQSVGPYSTVILAWALCLWFGAYWVLALWYFSLFTSFWAFLRMRELTEHTGTTRTHRLALPMWQRVLWSPHWISWHYEHHAHSNVACWNLPALRQQMANDPTPIMTSGEFYDWLATP